MFRRFSALSLIVLFALAFAPVYAQQATPAAATANTVVVTNLNDSGPGSLFQATNDAQAAEVAGGPIATITFAPGLTGTIHFGPLNPYITQDLRIDGPGSDKLELDTSITVGTIIAPIVHPQFFISNVSMAHAYQAIDNLSGTVHIEHVFFHDNLSSIVNAGGTIYVNDSVFTNKDTLYNIQNGDTMTISNSLFKDNGGISNYGKMLVYNSTFQNDYALGNLGQMEIVNSTFKRDHGVLHLIESGADMGIPSPSLKMTNTILYSATSSPKCIGPIVDEGRNLQFPGNDCGTSIPTVDPKLGILSDNGGLTRTIPLLPGSPAIGAGDPQVCTSVLQNRDQRGMTRSANGKCDIGAFEFGAASPVPTSAATAFVSAQ